MALAGAKSAFFCRALHIVHCQIIHLVELDQRWFWEAHTSRTKTGLALLADADSTLVIEIAILLAVVALILNGWQSAGVSELWHVSLRAFSQFRIDYLGAEIADSSRIFIS